MEQRFYNKAKAIDIKLNEKNAAPVQCFCIEEDETSEQGCKIVHAQPYDGKGERLEEVLYYDFGEHYTGYVSFRLSLASGILDAPIKIKIAFAERPLELIDAAEKKNSAQSKNADISYSWLQEEIVYIDKLPETVVIGRRYALRYLKIEVLAKTQRAAVVISDLNVRAVSSAPFDFTADITGTEYDEMCTACARTLRECMQNFYEDGPKRDRRLWLGDLRLQAIVNYDTFRDTELIKKCLYQFAAFNEKGKFLPSALFHEPELKADGETRLLDYALVFGVALCEYYRFSKDLEFVSELFEVAYNQFENLCTIIDEDGGLIEQEGWWCFIDWNDEMPKLLAMQAQAVYALAYLRELAEVVGKDDCAEKIEAVRKSLFENAYRKYYDKEKGVFAEESVVTWAGNCYMILSGFISEEDGRAIMKNLKQCEQAIVPVTPYAYHYCLEAYASLKMIDEMKDLLDKVWNGMIRCGADTFWEVYKYGDPTFSPYGDVRLNSFCHAWSCTPICFVKKYFCED